MLRAILLFLTLLSHGKKSFKFLFNISRINRSSSGILSARPSVVPSCRTFLFFLRCPGIILFSFLFIAQNPVCLSDFLKPFLCPLISRMFGAGLQSRRVASIIRYCRAARKNRSIICGEITGETTTSMEVCSSRQTVFWENQRI